MVICLVPTKCPAIFLYVTKVKKSSELPYQVHKNNAMPPLLSVIYRVIPRLDAESRNT